MTKDEFEKEIQRIMSDLKACIDKAVKESAMAGVKHGISEFKDGMLALQKLQKKENNATGK